MARRGKNLDAATAKRAVKAVTADVVAHFEAILASEGMPPEIRSLSASSKRDGLQVVSTTGLYETGDLTWAEVANADAFGAPTSLANTPTARYWAAFGQAVQALPPEYPANQRAFLEAYAETGCVDQALQELGHGPKSTIRPTTYLWLKRFAKYRQAHQ